MYWFRGSSPYWSAMFQDCSHDDKKWMTLAKCFKAGKLSHGNPSAKTKKL